MRLGGGIEKPYKNPDEWIKLVKELGYSCVLSPVDCSAGKEERNAYISFPLIQILLTTTSKKTPLACF